MLLSTDTVRPADRIAYWRDVVCETFVALDCRSTLRERFRGSVASHDAGGLNLTRVDADAQTVARTRTLIARSSDDVMLVSFAVQGDGRVVQDGREARLSPGDLALYDTTRPYELLFDRPFTQWVLKVPRAEMRRRLGTPEAFNGGARAEYGAARAPDTGFPDRLCGPANHDPVLGSGAAGWAGA